MFAYCLNNPVILSDANGTASTITVGDNLRGSVDPKMYFAACVGLGVAAGIAMVASHASADEDIQAYVHSLKDDSSKRIYTVYFLYAADGSPNEIVYVGRVKTAGYRARMNYHKTQGRLEKWRVDGLTWAECRGLEQIGMSFFHTINRDSTINNQIRGVSPRNDSRMLYFVAAKLFWSMVGNEYYNLMPISYWENWTENEFLNGGM